MSKWFDRLGILRSNQATYSCLCLAWVGRSATHEPNGTPPKAAALLTVAIASGIPFIGFGFLDNFIMVSLIIEQWSVADQQPSGLLTNVVKDPCRRTN